jgi:hypothetical protein
VLYGSAPDLAGASKQEQAFSPIYIGTINAGVLALVLLGSLDDVTGSLLPTLSWFVPLVLDVDEAPGWTQTNAIFSLNAAWKLG